MDRPQAVSIFPSETLENALEFANEHEFTYLPVVDTDRRTLMGYLPVRELDERLAAAEAQSDPTAPNAAQAMRREPVSAHMRRFQRRESRSKYKPITMFTPLEELEEFFAGGFSGGQQQDFAVITDDGGLVYGVVTKEDLIEFVKRRPV